MLYVTPYSSIRQKAIKPMSIQCIFVGCYPCGLTGHVAHPGSLHSEFEAALPSVSPIPSARLPNLKRLGDLLGIYSSSFFRF